MDKTIQVDENLILEQLQKLQQQVKREKDSSRIVDLQLRQADILLSAEVSQNQLANCLSTIEDDYIKAQIVIAKIPNDERNDNYRQQSPENTFAKIQNYGGIKKQFLEKNEDGKLGYLMRLSLDGTLVNQNDKTYIVTDSVTEHKDRNEIKKALLKELGDDNDKKTLQRKEIVIESFQRYVDPDLKAYDNLTNDIIEKFFKCHFGKLPPEQAQRLQMALHENNIMFANYNNNTGGLYQPLNKDITIANALRDNPYQIMICMLHEKMHACSLSNYLQDMHWMSNYYEEGMADVAASVIANEFFSHDYRTDLMIHDIPMIQVKTPIHIQTAYITENSFMNSMLYSIEKNGKDLEAMKDYLLGDKKEFLNKVFTPESVAQNVKLDAFKNPINPPDRRNEVLPLLLEVHGKDILDNYPSKKYLDEEVSVLYWKEWNQVHGQLPREETRTRDVLVKDENTGKVEPQNYTITTKYEPPLLTTPFQTNKFVGFNGPRNIREIRPTTTKNNIDEMNRRYGQDKKEKGKQTPLSPSLHNDK